MKIDFSPPDIHPEDIAAVVETLKSGWITTGPVSQQFESELAAFVGTRKVVLLNSCTAALELALRVAGVGPGDEVIVPAYTYSASAAVVLHVGANLVLIDTEPEGYAPSIRRVMEAVTPRTKAIIAVDVGGIPFPTDELLAELEASGSAASDSATAMGILPAVGRPVVIVDAAHSIGATRGGAPAGSIGDFTAFSFHAVKNLTTAEGGALTWRPNLEVDHAELAARVRRLSLHGQSKDALAKTKAGSWDYDILEPGHKANMPDVLAALGLSQLRRYDRMVDRRHEILRAYELGLGDFLEFPAHSGPRYRSSAHLALTALKTNVERRDGVIAELAARGVSTNVHYKPLPMLTAYAARGFVQTQFPHAMAQYRREVTLPLHTKLSDDAVAHVVNQVRDVILSGAG